MAIVHFYIDSSSNDLINKIVKTPRVTTADILSNIGQFKLMTLPFKKKNFDERYFFIDFFRWSYGTIYRIQHSQFLRNNLLALSPD